MKNCKADAGGAAWPAGWGSSRGGSGTIAGWSRAYTASGAGGGRTAGCARLGGVSAEYLLTGAVLPLWQTVAAITSARRDAGRNMRSVNANNGAMASPTSPPMTAAAAQHLHNDRDKPKGVLRVVRTELDDGRLVLGLHLGKEDVEALEQRLEDAVETVRETRVADGGGRAPQLADATRERPARTTARTGTGVSEVEIELREPESSVCENRIPSPDVTGCDESRAANEPTGIFVHLIIACMIDY